MSMGEDLMVYLICQKCGGYYELKGSESPADYDTCECGDTLKKADTTKNENNSKENYPRSINNTIINGNPGKGHNDRFCPKCGTGNKQNADFCKKCGYNLKNKGKNFINRLNDKINLLGVFIGLVFSLLVLLIASLFSGMLIYSGNLGIMGFAYIVLLSMTFIGGFVTSMISCKTYSEGITNGGFLGLVTIVNFGFIVGALWFSTMAVVSSIAKSFSSLGGSSSSSTAGSSYNPYSPSSSSSSAPSANTSVNDYIPLIELILLPFLIVLLGMAGGWFGVFIKKQFK